MKKIICILLSVLMLLGALPVAVLAEEIGSAVEGFSDHDDSLPVVIVESLYSYHHYEVLPEDFYRALPNENGVFYFDITLEDMNKAPTNGEEILVYYRTVDDTAVSVWGDYEGVGVHGDACVKLNRANGYKARVTVNSTVLPVTSVGNDWVMENPKSDALVSPRFIFELIDVVGNAKLYEPDPNTYSGTIADRNKSRLYCYLKGEQYFNQTNHGTYLDQYKQSAYLYDESPFVSLINNTINTPFIYYQGSESGNLNYQMPNYFRTLLATGRYNLGVSLLGLCQEDFWNNEGPVTLDLYYTYQGEQKKALTLIIEGQFDESEFFGWEHAFDYAEGEYRDEELADGSDVEYDIDDFIEDNFYGFILYDNDGNEAYRVMKEEGKEIEDLATALLKCETDGYAVEQTFVRMKPSIPVSHYELHWLKMPTNFAYADSYSWTFTTETFDDWDGRRLKDVMFTFCLYDKDTDVKIVTDDAGNQMVTTNIDTLREGDPLRMTVRLSHLLYFDTQFKPECITAKINGIYDVTLNMTQLSYNDAENWHSNIYYAWDTFVFEGDLPEELDGITITHLTDIKWETTSVGDVGYSYLRDYELPVLQPVYFSSTAIHDIYGFGRDLRTPVATVSVKNSDLWSKSKSLDIYVNAQENINSRFNDYVTVYYQWSNSQAAPKTYGSKITFHTGADGEVLKTIIGTGNGEMYLHLKAVSGYGKSSVSSPFGPFKFDNDPPKLSAEKIGIAGDLKDRTISVPIPDDNGGSGLREAILYYVGKDGEGVRLRTFTADDFTGTPKILTYEITHDKVGIGVDANGQEIHARGEVEFYWELIDKLGNASGKTAEFALVFDTYNYISEDVISEVGPLNFTENDEFVTNPEKINDKTFVYDYKDGNNTVVNDTASKPIYYSFGFKIDGTRLTGDQKEYYSILISYNGTALQSGEYSVIREDVAGSGSSWIIKVHLHKEIESGRYDIRLVRSLSGENASEQVSQVYTVYATANENETTAVKSQVEFGTLLSNTVYQLSTEYPYFYYKDTDGAIQKVNYNGTKQPATFSSFEKAKEYVYFKELSDIYLVELSATTASALASGTGGYLLAKGETTVPQAGQYWIRYKSESWTPTSGEYAWVYYYYGDSAALTEGALSANLLKALNAVSARIAGYGKSVVLTDTSLILGSVTGNKLLDDYGMPYLLPGQIHASDELSAETMCANAWTTVVGFAADKNIYRSTVSVGIEGEDGYGEYPLVGSFDLPEDSIFQYKTLAQFGDNASKWVTLHIKKGQSFIDVLGASGVYYIREVSTEGVSVFAIYIDKEAPDVTFTQTDENGSFREIPVDGKEVLDIRTKDLYIGSISPNEYDRLSYVAVYKASGLSLVGVYTAADLALAPVKLTDGNYYIVVSDRSGNHYTVTAKVSSTLLACDIKESADKYIKLTCNRRSDQIYRYEVYLNGELLTSTYAEEQTFTKAGNYRIYIQDIYGNEFIKEYLFERNYPAVTWKYYGSDGKYHTYDPQGTNTQGFVLTWVSDNQYKLSTAVQTKFSFGADFGYEFIGSTPKHSETLGAETAVTIDAGQSFTLKVYYKNHKDCYTVYTGVVDVTPPSLNVSADVDVLENGENSLFDDWAQKGNVGDVIRMEELYYILSGTKTVTLSNGGAISSDLIKIHASDANDLSLVEVYLDGARIEKQDLKSGFSQIIVNKPGQYRIVAKDTLGNTSEFTFKNGMPDSFDCFVDGAEKGQELHGYLNFETVGGKKVYSKIHFGNKDFRLNVKQNATVFMSVGVSGGTAEIYGFTVSEGRICSLTYKIVSDENGKKTIDLVTGEAILDMTAKDFKVDKEYRISKTGAYAVYASVGTDKTVSIKVYAPEDASKVVSVNARIENASANITSFVSVELSKKSSSLTLEGLGIQNENDIRLNSGFTVDESMFESERISGISLYYSKLNDLDATKLEGKTNVYVAGREYDAEGFYLLIVRNHYGNERVYRIAISTSFGITSSVTFADGNKIYYSKNYNGTLYSNSEIVLDLLTDDIVFTVTKGGAAYTAYAQKKDGRITYLMFSEAGTYAVKLTDSYGNEITKTLVIDKSAYKIPDNLLTGYNDKALKRDEGYTNQKLSVDKSVYGSAGIYYLAIQYGDVLTVLSDAFSETPVAINESALVDAVGSSGDGVYKVICRNRYGAIVTKEIHYRGTPTLTLERTTRSKSEPEVYDLGYAISLGFWSNNTLSFRTDAKEYIFTVNGSVTECPRTFVFGNAGDFGSFEYEITYMDEYGFEYSFTAYLVRKNVDVNIPTHIGTTEIDGVLNTKNDISITFGENIYATYTRNNGEEVVYHSEDVLKKDGTYRFTVIDYAGNATLLTVKKDTAVEFSFVDSVSGAVIENGSVVNSVKIEFNALNKDSAYIEKVIHNGVIQTDFTGSKFAEDGKWELVVCDKLGNRSYFSFYIVTRDQNGFAYTTPYEYRITEMWYDSGDGINVSYLTFVSHDDHTSSFNFKENGKYTVVMTSGVTGKTSTFEFAINTTAPAVSLLGCNNGETTINDVTFVGCKVGDRIMIYRETETGEGLVEEIEITSLSTKIPTVTEGGKYRVVIESEAGVQTELSFVRKHVMNTAGSIFIMVVIGLSVVGLFTGLVYRNKSKTDD